MPKFPSGKIILCINKLIVMPQAKCCPGLFGKWHCLFFVRLFVIFRFFYVHLNGMMCQKRKLLWVYFFLNKLLNDTLAGIVKVWLVRCNNTFVNMCSYFQTFSLQHYKARCSTNVKNALASKCQGSLLNLYFLIIQSW